MKKRLNPDLVLFSIAAGTIYVILKATENFQKQQAAIIKDVVREVSKTVEKAAFGNVDNLRAPTEQEIEEYKKTFGQEWYQELPENLPVDPTDEYIFDPINTPSANGTEGRAVVGSLEDEMLLQGLGGAGVQMPIPEFGPEDYYEEE